MITALLAALCVAMLFQPNFIRLYAVACFVGLSVAHDVFLSNLDGLPYYGSAALFDLTTIMLTAYLRPIPQIVPRLHIVCLASIIMNCFGWVLWMLYFPPIVYNQSFIALYFAAIVAILWEDHIDVGSDTMDQRRFNFFTHNNSSNIARPANEG